ncbi:MAG TPA: hypothetical protein VJU61_22580 [Polyangiaceae bacterium]|nr:hypothetical protein [Polyangiaceae bacterium]
MEDGQFVGFEQWTDVLRWVKTNSQGRNPRWTYYVSPELHEEGRPIKVSCQAIVRDVNGKMDEQIHVSPANPNFGPFDANVDHLGYFRRGEHTSLPVRSSETGAKPFDIWKLLEPTEGPVYTCGKCKTAYRAHPFQSHQLCKVCKPPTHRCKHGMTTFEPCPDCRKLTGRDGQYVGLTPIVLARRD